MPRLNDEQIQQHGLPQSHYGYSATRLENLGATEYTLASIITDVSGSVSPFKTDLETCIEKIIEACKLSPRADNLMVRLVQFDDKLDELHGFKLLETCNLADYRNSLTIGGMTALYDATENGINATIGYGQQLQGQDFQANAIVFVLTDGGDNASTFAGASGRNRVKKALEAAVKSEALESIVSILIGVNVQDSSVSSYLQDFHKEAGFTQYVEIAKADAKTLAKLADFVSRSISAQSQALGTGGPSQSLTF